MQPWKPFGAPSNSSSSIAGNLRTKPKCARQSSITSKCFTTASACTVRWATEAPQILNAQRTKIMTLQALAKTPTRQLESFCPVKQKRALLKSNPPRDNWIEGDEITVSTLGRPKPPQNKIWRG